MSKKKRERRRKDARRADRRPPRRRLLVVTEGQRTERDYIRGFEAWARNATVDVYIPSERGDPRRLVEIAHETQQQAEARARR